MKKLSYFALFLIAGFALAFGIGMSESVEGQTTLKIVNNSSEDSVLTYLTLGAEPNWTNEVKGIFGIKDSGLQGSFYAHKDSVYTYKSTKPISGTVSFHTPPINCPTPEFLNGVNVFEFTLNNYGTVNKAQETFDISCVAGLNVEGSIKTSSDNWICNGHAIDSVYNDTLHANTGLKGVYPFRCDNCTEIVNPPSCRDELKSSTPQPDHICNVSRNAIKSGGTVTIYYNKNVNVQALK